MKKILKDKIRTTFIKKILKDSNGGVDEIKSR